MPVRTIVRKDLATDVSRGLRFEIGGTTVDESLVPANLRTITVDDDVPVVVREVQTRVTKVR